MSLQQLIDELPDARQRSAIRDFNRCVMIASPGSGKTYRLVLKLAYLLGQKISDLQTIACVTFMNEAVREIESRISAFGFEDEERLFVGTVHNFCINSIILPFRSIYLPDWPEPMQIADGERQAEVLEEAITQLGLPLPQNERRHWAITKYGQIIHSIRVEELFEESGYHSEQEYELLARYTSNMRDHGLIDFDDIAIEACRLVVKYPAVRDYLTSRYPWYVVDEYQDLGSVFNALFNCLVENTNVKFFVVGDVNQSIMGFQGAEPTFLQKLANRSDVEAVIIHITRRCLPHIIEIANRLLPEDQFQTTTLQKHDHSRQARLINCNQGTEQQVQKIIEEVEDLNQNQNIPLGEIAVLCRNTDTIQMIASAFTKAKISYSGDKDGRYPRTPLTRWLEDLAAWLRGGWETGDPKFQRINREFHRFIYKLEVSPFARMSGLELDAHFLQTLWECRNTGLTVSDWLAFLAEKLYIDIIAEGLSHTDPYNAKALWKLSEATQHGAALAEMTVADLALCGRSEESVFLTTLHSSKGLEFGAVIIPDLEEGRLPDWRKTSSADIAEERRLLYVGITRAKNEIILLYSGFYTLPWGQTISRGPSRFLRELGFL